jgi:tagaturonate reductase
VAFLAGLNTVGESMNDAQITEFVEKAISQEIVPVLDLPADELKSFADAVLSRFRNPYIQHQLLSSALNGMTKYRTRILPQVLAYQQQTGKLPQHLCFALAALIAFYRGERDGETYPLQDDAHWLERYHSGWSAVKAGGESLESFVQKILSDADHWGQDLNQIPEMTQTITGYLQQIEQHGMRSAVSSLFVTA